MYGPELLVDGHWNPLLSLLFPMALQSSMLFRATVIGSRAVLSASAGQPLQQDTILMREMGILIQDVQVALSSSDGLNDELLLAIMWMTLAEVCAPRFSNDLKVQLTGHSVTPGKNRGRNRAFIGVL
jgi:hypothetical protein